MDHSLRSGDVDDLHEVRFPRSVLRSDERPTEYYRRNQSTSDYRAEPSRQTYDLSHRDTNYISTTRIDDNRSTGERKNRASRPEDEDGSLGFERAESKQTGGDSENGTGRYNVPKQGTLDSYQAYDRRSNILENTQHTPPEVDFKIDPIRRTTPANSRTCVIDINISINFVGNTPQASVTSRNITSRSPPNNSTATIDNVRSVELDFRVPEHTAQLSTDGIIRQPQNKRSSANSNNN